MAEKYNRIIKLIENGDKSDRSYVLGYIHGCEANEEDMTAIRALAKDKMGMIL